MVEDPEVQSEEQAQAHEGALAHKRRGLGILVAQLVCPLVFTPFVFHNAILRRTDPGLSEFLDFIKSTLLIGMFCCIVTFVLTLFVGIPVFALYKKLGWKDLPRHLLGGAAIGVMPILLLTGFDLSTGLGQSLAVIGAGLGALAVGAYWLVAYGSLWAWKALFAVCLFGVTASLSYLTVA